MRTLRIVTTQLLVNCLHCGKRALNFCSSVLLSKKMKQKKNYDI